MSVWEKAYQNWIRWVNRPSTQSPIDEIALNKISNGLDTVDDRVLSLNSTKADQVTLNGLLKDITLNTTNGVITITWFDNTTRIYDTLLEKMAVNFDYDDDPSSPHYQNLVITLDDGTIKYVDMSALITQYEFVDTDTITFTQQSDGKIKAAIKSGSITRTLLNPDYLAQIDASVAAAAASASNAATSESNAHADALLAESHNHGGTGVRDNEATDNAMYYKQQAEISATAAASSASAASSSETNAAISEANASTSETNAAASASDASASALAASSSETNAHTSETNAANSATAAATSATNAATSQQIAEQEASDSEAWAVGQRGGIDVESTDPTYENNSKFYKEQSASNAAAAAQSYANVLAVEDEIDRKTALTVFSVDFTTGELIYTEPSVYTFTINRTTGNLEWEVA